MIRGGDGEEAGLMERREKEVKLLEGKTKMNYRIKREKC